MRCPQPVSIAGIVALGLAAAAAVALLAPNEARAQLQLQGSTVGAPSKHYYYYRRRSNILPTRPMRPTYSRPLRPKAQAAGARLKARTRRVPRS